MYINFRSMQYMEGMDSSSRLSDAHARSALHSHVEQANLYASHTTAALHECRHGHLAPKLTTVTLRSTRTGFRSWIEPSSLCVGVPGARGLGCNRCRARLPGCPRTRIHMRCCLGRTRLAAASTQNSRRSALGGGRHKIALGGGRLVPPHRRAGHHR